MKKMILTSIGVLSLTSLFAAGYSTHSGGKTLEQYCESIVPITEMTQQMAEEFFNGKLTSVVVKCSKGCSLPFRMNLTSEFLEFDSGEAAQSITVLRDCYIKNDGVAFLFSGDLNSWKNFENFFTGSFGIALSYDGGSQKEAIFNVELHQRPLSKPN